jgi:hypothetical protein
MAIGNRNGLEIIDNKWMLVVDGNKELVVNVYQHGEGLIMIIHRDWW